MAKICPCPQPPGGHIICEDNQFGMCAYHEGEKVGGCLDIPTTIAVIKEPQERNLAIVNWILTSLTVIGRSWNEPLDADGHFILTSGTFVTRHGLTIRFSLPNNLDMDMVQVARENVLMR